MVVEGVEPEIARLRAIGAQRLDDGLQTSAILAGSGWRIPTRRGRRTFSSCAQGQASGSTYLSSWPVRSSLPWSKRCSPRVAEAHSKASPVTARVRRGRDRSGGDDFSGRVAPDEATARRSKVVLAVSRQHVLVGTVGPHRDHHSRAVGILQLECRGTSDVERPLDSEHDCEVVTAADRRYEDGLGMVQSRALRIVIMQWWDGHCAHVVPVGRPGPTQTPRRCAWPDVKQSVDPTG